ncbi:DUF2155 domain-containing protein [Nioella sediminis]|jgi:hypothetical protein|uniref:DUF2155 domain-containing protein n=1 Tax=Nioella sediminis TaxID=1912092 RepID=UPI0009F80F9A|nr:DUF2155 domain-containing protein [Nioella sediminis]
MTLRALALALLLPATAFAQEGVELTIEPNPNVDAGPPVVTAPGALLRGLDKSVGRATDIELATGQTVVFGRIAVRLLECRYPEGAPGSEAYAHVQITDLEGQGLFDGWMIATSPALSALEHPRYDVWVLRCNTASGETQDG